MAPIRRDVERAWPRIIWPLLPFDAWRRWLGEQRVAGEEFMDQGRVVVRYGSFTRTLPLPLDTKADEITASYHDGILEVRAPVAETRTNRSRIPINQS